MDAATTAHARRWCESMLPHVSRTFALNIRLLPGELRQAVLQAYLLCRIADTIEDDDVVAPPRKPNCLREYSNLLPQALEHPQRLQRWLLAFDSVPMDTPERRLCRDAEQVFVAFASLSRPLQAPIEVCVREMSLGMADFAGRSQMTPEGGLQIESMQELESYCHIVAGTVGNMLCELFLEQIGDLPHEQRARMRSLSERFGLALQLVNIIQDVCVDRRRGVTYLPRQVVAAQGIRPEQLFLPGNGQAWLAVLAEMVALALRSCDAALEFSLLLPRRQVRLRLFCLWPLFLAIRTLEQILKEYSYPETGSRPRVPRRHVRRCLLHTSLRVGSDSMLQAFYRRERQRVADRLQRVAGGAAAAVGQAPRLSSPVVAAGKTSE